MDQEYPGYQIQKGKFPWRTAIFAFVVILLVVIAFISAKPKATIVAMENVTSTADLAANVLFASSIDSKFNYQIQPNAEYLQDKGIYIYIEVANFIQRGGAVDVTEDLEIKDAAGKVVFSRNAFGSSKKNYSDNVALIRFSNVVPTLNWNAGNYYARIVINDNIAGTSLTKMTEFSIKEKSKDVVEKTVDLSKIVSSNITQTKLVKQQTVWDPSGKIIPELTLNKTVTGDLSALDLSRIDVSFKIPDRFDAGIYVVEIKYINLQNGQYVAVKDNVPVIKQLALSDMIFASSINNNFNYVIQPNSIYAQGNDVYIYMRLVDFAQPLSNGKYSVNFTENAYILDENGAVKYSKPNYFAVNEQSTVKKDVYEIKNSLSSFVLGAGNYIYKVVIKDLNTGQETTKQEVFSIS